MKKLYAKVLSNDEWNTIKIIQNFDNPFYDCYASICFAEIVPRKGEVSIYSIIGYNLYMNFFLKELNMQSYEKHMCLGRKPKKMDGDL